jgi:uncharacterized protein (TIGR02284 family)
MLRDDRQVALNQVIEAALTAARAHEQGAALLEDAPDSAAALRALAERRSHIATVLGEHLRRLGDLPKDPDADLEAAKELLARVRVAFSEDKRQQVRQQAQEVEAHLAEAVRGALEQDLPADTRTALQDLLAAVDLEAALG